MCFRRPSSGLCAVPLLSRFPQRPRKSRQQPRVDQGGSVRTHSSFLLCEVGSW